MGKFGFRAQWGELGWNCRRVRVSDSATNEQMSMGRQSQDEL